MTMYTYEVELFGEWRRPETLRAEMENVELRLRWTAGFREVKVEGRFPALRGNWWDRWDRGNEGTFQIVTDVEAPNATTALETAKRRVRRELKNMYLCRAPRLTFL